MAFDIYTEIYRTHSILIKAIKALMLTPDLILTSLIFIAAILYAAVGHGGASGGSAGAGGVVVADGHRDAVRDRSGRSGGGGGQFGTETGEYGVLWSKLPWT